MTRSRLFVASLLAASALASLRRPRPSASTASSRSATAMPTTAISSRSLGSHRPDPAPIPTGRFSGGTNYIDTLGQLLNVPIDNFAIGGALTEQHQHQWLPDPAAGLRHRMECSFLGAAAAASSRQSAARSTKTICWRSRSAATTPASTSRRRHRWPAGAPAAATASAAFATAGLNALVAAGAQNISFLAGNTALPSRNRRRPDGRGDPQRLFDDVQHRACSRRWPAMPPTA